MTLVIVHDATTGGYSSLPPGMAAGYSTGHGIAWTEAQFKGKPGAVRIDQDPDASDPTADVLDVETGAATYADCPKWVKAAHADILAKKRPGQRVTPAIYMSKSNVTNVVNELVNAGITSGVALWVASWTGSTTAGDAAVTDTGPFPIIACQFDNQALYDTSVFEPSWLDDVVTLTVPTSYSATKLPPGRWQGMSVYSGTGTDGDKWHTSTDDGKNWSTPRRS